MASSVASAREMERWAKERREAQQRSVYMPAEAKRGMSSMKPDFEHLETFEKRVHQLAERDTLPPRCERAVERNEAIEQRSQRSENSLDSAAYLGYLVST